MQLLAGMLVFFFAADKSFINLNRAVKLTAAVSAALIF